MRNRSFVIAASNQYPFNGFGSQPSFWATDNGWAVWAPFSFRIENHGPRRVSVSGVQGESVSSRRDVIASWFRKRSSGLDTFHEVKCADIREGNESPLIEEVLHGRWNQHKGRRPKTCKVHIEVIGANRVTVSVLLSEWIEKGPMSESLAGLNLDELVHHYRLTPIDGERCDLYLCLSTGQTRHEGSMEWEEATRRLLSLSSISVRPVEIIGPGGGWSMGVIGKFPRTEWCLRSAMTLAGVMTVQ